METLPETSPGQGEDSTTVTKPSAGKMLREARERLSLSIADVAEQTKLAHRQVEALEADDFQRLPEMPFVRGFVRSYAKILHLDAQPLLAALPQAKEVSKKLTPTSVEVPFPNAHLSQRQNRIWLGAALLLSGVVAFVMWHYTPSSVQPETAQVEATASVPGGTQAKLVSPAAEVEVVVPPVATAPQPPAESDEPAVKAGKTQITPTLPQTQVVKPVEQPDAPVQPAVLRLMFNEESWTEIKGRDDKMLASQVNLPGSELRLSGQAPFSLVIGHAASVRLYYRGKQVDLTPHINATSEVARLTLE